jgi:transcriptional regulator with XRE-family HTH domain
MISKTAISREAARRSRRSSLRLGEEIRDLRLDAGVSLRELAAATGLDPSHLARIEKANVHASLEALTIISVALGADLGLRLFAGVGPRIHDRFQAPMLEALLRVLAPRWLPRLEVAIPRPVRGVADLVLTDRAGPTTVIGEAQSEFRRIEQQLRWMAEKAKALEELAGDGRSVSRLLIVRSTEATRAVVRRYSATMSAAYPARTADVVDSLTNGRPWPGDGIAWMRLEHGHAELLSHPPRGVPMGR